MSSDSLGDRLHRSRPLDPDGGFSEPYFRRKPCQWSEDSHEALCEGCYSKAVGKIIAEETA